MKKLFTILAVAATLVSCAKEDVVREAEGEAIQFGNAFVENSTRANDPSYSANDIKSFNVYGTVNGVVIYPGTEITKGTAAYGAAWTCPVDQYWIAGANYKFVGIVDGNKTGVTVTNLTNNMPTTISYTADGKTDLLCQTITKTAKTDGTANGLVAFNFNHLLSKVNFTINNGSKDASGYSFVVKNIKFNGATSATYDIANNKWINLGADDDTLLGNTRKVDGNDVKDIVVASGDDSAELGTEVLFIPGEYTITFTVDILYDGNVITSTKYPATGSYSHTLAANNAYNFNVGVSVGEKIQFTVEKQPEWGNGNTHDSDDDDVNDYIPLQ